MPTIEIDQSDYDLLMAMSKELQMQENDSQAFPYFWGPMSKKEGIGTNDDEPRIYDGNAAETYTPDDFADNNEDKFSLFLAENELPEDTEYIDIDESEWMSWVEENCPDCSIVYSREEDVSEPNFSLFKSDVQNHISGNRHHLGKNPHTYARTFFRMEKMEDLVRIIYRMNPIPEEQVNEEARRYVVKVG